MNQNAESPNPTPSQLQLG